MADFQGPKLFPIHVTLQFIKHWAKKLRNWSVFHIPRKETENNDLYQGFKGVINMIGENCFLLK